ncbi:hypothetical protein [Serinicoccus sp. CUA-874]|uniref:hypothetical protein n=1 Tax=Serinicoccus sp. CUA-874 TaxID=1517939 RepID=UPI00269C01CE
MLEGTQREALRYADGWVDCHVMGLLASDWAARPDRGPTSPSTTLIGKSADEGCAGP